MDSGRGRGGNLRVGWSGGLLALFILMISKINIATNRSQTPIMTIAYIQFVGIPSLRASRALSLQLTSALPIQLVISSIQYSFI